MRAGPLNRRARVQVKSTAQDSAGELIETWADLWTIWVEKRDLRMAERSVAGQTVAEVDTLFIARWWPARQIRPEQHRLVVDGKIYEVHGMAELRLGVEIQCAARGEAAFEV